MRRSDAYTERVLEDQYLRYSSQRYHYCVEVPQVDSRYDNDGGMRDAGGVRCEVPGVNALFHSPMSRSTVSVLAQRSRSMEASDMSVEG